jgi:hypothetical protein
MELTMIRFAALTLAGAVAFAAGMSVADAQQAAAPKKVAAKAGCIKAGGTGTGVTEDFAKFMSGAAAKNSAKAWGGDSVKLGPVVHKCDSGYPFACSASVKACR